MSIERATLGSYRLKVERQGRTVRAKRLKQRADADDVVVVGAWPLLDRLSRRADEEEPDDAVAGLAEQASGGGRMRRPAGQPAGDEAFRVRGVRERHRRRRSPTTPARARECDCRAAAGGRRRRGTAPAARSRASPRARAARRQAFPSRTPHRAPPRATRAAPWAHARSATARVCRGRERATRR